MTHEHIVVVRLNRIASLLIGGEHDMDGWCLVGGLVVG